MPRSSPDLGPRVHCNGTPGHYYVSCRACGTSASINAPAPAEARFLEWFKSEHGDAACMRQEEPHPIAHLGFPADGG